MLLNGTHVAVLGSLELVEGYVKIGKQIWLIYIISHQYSCRGTSRHRSTRNPEHRPYQSLFSSCSTSLTQVCRLAKNDREAADTIAYDWRDLRTGRLDGSKEGDLIRGRVRNYAHLWHDVVAIASPVERRCGPSALI